MTVWLSYQAFLQMQKEVQGLSPLETGGLLLGWRSGPSNVIIRMTGPGPNALHGLHRYLPDHQWDVDQIHREFQRSGGDLDYLGDWHSHPNGALSMSEEDRSTLCRISRRIRNPLMIIVDGGPYPGGKSLGCWMAERSGWSVFGRYEPVQQTVRLFDPPADWRLDDGECSATPVIPAV